MATRTRTPRPVTATPPDSIDASLADARAMASNDAIARALESPTAFAEWLRSCAEIEVGDRNEPGYTPLACWLYARTGRRPIILPSGAYRLTGDLSALGTVPEWAKLFVREIAGHPHKDPASGRAALRQPITGAEALDVLRAITGDGQ